MAVISFDERPGPLQGVTLPAPDITAYRDIYDSDEEASAFLAQGEADRLQKIIAAGNALHAHVTHLFATPPQQTKLRLKMPGSRTKQVDPFVAFISAYESLPREGRYKDIRDACATFEQASRVAEHLATACHASAACMAAGETGPKADIHYAKMRDALRLACSAVDYPATHLPQLRLQEREIAGKYKTAMQAHYTQLWQDAPAALRASLEALYKTRVDIAAQSFSEDDAELRALLKGQSHLPQNMQVGDLIQGEGIYLGIEAYTAGNLSAEFHIFAAPENSSSQQKSYRLLAAEVTNFRDWHGHDGAGYDCVESFNSSIQQGTYRGQWVIPPASIVENRIKENTHHLRLNKYMHLDYISLQKADGAYTLFWFDQNDSVYSANGSTTHWCRPVRLVPVNPDAYARTVAALEKSARRRGMMIRTAMCTVGLGTVIFAGTHLFGSRAPDTAPTQPTTTSSEKTQQAAPAAAKRAPWYIHP